MLAHSKTTLAFLVTGLLFIGSALGQQTPSQRYQPVRDVATQPAPSAHVPPQQARKLAPQFRAVSQGNTGARYTFSDTPQKPVYRQPANGRPAQPAFVEAGSSKATIQQTSYQIDEPVVPAILRGREPVFQVPTKLPTAPVVQNVTPVVDTATRKTPADFASSIEQIRNTSPRIAPNELASQQDSISEQMAELRRRAAEKARLLAEQEAQELAARAEAERLELERLENERKVAQQLEAERIAAAQAEAQRQEAERQEAIRLEAEKMAQQRIAALEAKRLEAENLAAEKAEALRIEAEKFAAQRAENERLASLAETRRIEMQKAEAARLAMMERAKASEAARQAENERLTSLAETRRMEMQKAEAARLAAIEKAEAAEAAMKQASATEFISKLNTPQEREVAPVAKRISSVDMTSGENQIRQVSSTADAPEAAISLTAPALNVETFGPRTVGVNKPATYQVVVKNNSTTEADRILVGINLPQWVDIENVNLTTGGREITDGENQARLVWTIDKIPGNASQTITVTAVPRKPEAFDVGVEWTLVPRVGKSSVAVTEPKLEMTISGPQEVLYGETALYHVTCRNPGTGAAENVIVMLPEALGGERATLGNIEAGKEKNFQVELLARTAGDLNLVATAAGEQNLKTSAERALIVRRANLQVGMEGPGLKYAGSGAQYNITVTNNGDATAQEVVTAVALPTGVKYLSGVDSAKLIEGGLRWTVGNLEPGQTRNFKINCELNTSGDLQLEVGARGKGELAASSACLTSVETVADLVLTVADPKGPLPTGEKVPYTIKVQNRGSKSAKGVNLVMQFSEGIEPLKAAGLEHRIVPGQVLFTPIANIDPGQEMSFKVTAEALKSGTHIFRAQLTCQDSDAREIAEGTTRFFGEQIQRSATATTPAEKSTSNDFSFQR